MKKAVVFINEDHSLLPEQIGILHKKFPWSWEVFPVPRNGWNREEQKYVASLFQGEPVVFISPIPFLLKILAQSRGIILGGNEYPLYYNEYPLYYPGPVLVFHNSSREKKELPGGKVIFVVPTTGWELI